MSRPTDHVEEARELLHECEGFGPDREQLAARVSTTALVHSQLAIAEELRGIREALGDYFGDDSKVDWIARSLQEIAVTRS